MLLRFFSQLTVFLKYRLYLYLPCARAYCLLYILAPWAAFARPVTKTPLQDGLEKMGPIFIKFGQFLSARSDLFSPHILGQLEKLCDRVKLSEPQFFIPEIERLQQQFQIQVDPQPLAAASIAHVYTGILPSGEKVAIKIQRPDLPDMVSEDLHVLSLIISLVALFAPKRLQLKRVFERFSNTLTQEMNFKREAAQADALKTALAQYTEHCEIPKIYWSYVTETTLVLQKVPGIRFQSLLQLNLPGAHLEKIAKKLYNIFLHSVFQQGLFHADLHVGNIFYDLAQDKFWFVDFGIVARLDQRAHKLLCRQVVALLKKDYVAMAQAFVDGGWTPPSFSMLERQNFEWSLHMLIAPWMDCQLQEISLAVVLKDVIQLAKKYHIQVQPEMILLQKTLFVVEGLVRNLYPHINLIKEGASEVLRSVKNRYGLQSKIQAWINPVTYMM